MYKFSFIRYSFGTRPFFGILRLAVAKSLYPFRPGAIQVRSVLWESTKNLALRLRTNLYLKRHINWVNALFPQIDRLVNATIYGRLWNKLTKTFLFVGTTYIISVHNMCAPFSNIDFLHLVFILRGTLLLLPSDTYWLLQYFCFIRKIYSTF